MYAADDLGDALHVTKRYLDSLGLVEYLKLAAVVLFIGGLGLGNQFTGADIDPAANWFESTTGVGLEVVLVVVGLAVYAGFRYLAALLEFVFVESLRSNAMAVRSYASGNARQAFWLFLFRTGLWLVLIAVVASVVAAFVFSGNVDGIDDVTAGQVLSILGVGFVGYVGLWIVYTLTTAFVVPVMLLENRGPIGGWRRVAPVLRQNWTGAFAFLGVAWGIGATLWMIFAFVGIFVMFIGLFLGLFAYMLLTEIHPDLVYLFWAIGLLAALGYAYALSLLEAPVRSYVRYYALLLLGDTDESLDLVPEQRGAVRSDGSAASTDRARSGGQQESSRWNDSSETTDATAGTDRSSDHDRSEPDSWNESSGWSDQSSWDGSTDDESPSDLADDRGDAGTDNSDDDSSPASESDDPGTSDDSDDSGDADDPWT